MKRSTTLAGVLIFTIIAVGTVVGLGTTSGGSELKRPQEPLTQDRRDADTRVIAPAPSDTSSLSMSSMDFHGAFLRANKEQLSVLMAENFQATMPNGAVLDRVQFLAGAEDTKLFYRATVAPANVRGNTATTYGTIVPIRGKRETRQRIGFTDRWEKRGDRWLLIATVIKKWKTYPRRHR